MTDAERDAMLTTIAERVAELYGLYTLLMPLIQAQMGGLVPMPSGAGVPSVKPW